MFPATSLPHFGVRRQSEAATALWTWGEDYTYRLRKTIQSDVALPPHSKVGTPGRTRTCNLDVRSVALFQLSYRSGGIADFRLLIANLFRGNGPIGNRKSAFGNGLVGEDRIELSPRVPKTRMLALHHTPKEKEKGKS